MPRARSPARRLSPQRDPGATAEGRGVRFVAGGGRPFRSADRPPPLPAYPCHPPLFSLCPGCTPPPRAPRRRARTPLCPARPGPGRGASLPSPRAAARGGGGGGASNPSDPRPPAPAEGDGAGLRVGGGGDSGGPGPRPPAVPRLLRPGGRRGDGAAAAGEWSGFPGAPGGRVSGTRSRWVVVMMAGVEGGEGCCRVPGELVVGSLGQNPASVPR